MLRRLIDLAPDQRPRQRLAEVGPWALSDAELLAVLLSSGCCGRSVVQTTEEVLAETGGLVEVSKMGIEELMAIPGFGKARAAILVTAVELGRRMARATLKDSPRLDDIEPAGEYLVNLLQDEQRDVFGFLSLDSCHRMIGQRELRIEDQSNVPLDALATELLRQAILDSSDAIMLYHRVG
jgi:DNA repair protein RadC